MKTVRWPLLAAVLCIGIALTLEGWVFLGPFVHGDESRMAAIMIVASNAVVGAIICTGVVRRYAGTRSPIFWGLSMLSGVTVLASLVAWRLFLGMIGG